MTRTTLVTGLLVLGIGAEYGWSRARTRHGGPERQPQVGVVVPRPGTRDDRHRLRPRVGRGMAAPKTRTGTSPRCPVPRCARATKRPVSAPPPPLEIRFGLCVPCKVQTDVVEIPSTPRRTRITVCRAHLGPYLRRLDLAPKLNTWAGMLKRHRAARVGATE